MLKFPLYTPFKDKVNRLFTIIGRFVDPELSNIENTDVFNSKITYNLLDVMGKTVVTVSGKELNKFISDGKLIQL